MTDKQVVTVSQHTVFLAEAAIIQCGCCSTLPGVPFAQILEKVGSHAPGTANYILPILGCCPFCKSHLDEQAIVVPKPQKGVPKERIV